MTLQEVLGSLDYSLLRGSLQVRISHLTENSEEIQPGSLFFCRKGMHTDGVYFLARATERGAAAVVCTEACEEVLEFLAERGPAAVVVRDMQEAMETSAKRFYKDPAASMTLIGVTGTKGKTTVSTLIYRIIRAMKRKALLIGTNGVELDGKYRENAHTTPPLLELYAWLAKARDEGCFSAVLEVSSLAVKQGRIGSLAFDLGIFTNLYPDHISETEHASMEEYRFWKEAFLRRCRICVINLDDAWGAELKKKLSCPVIGYSLKQEAEYSARKIQYVVNSGFWGSEYMIRGGYAGIVRLSMPGSFNVSNSLAAAAAADWLGAGFDLVQSVFWHTAVKGRCQVAAYSRGICVIVDYAHNESSMEAVLSMAEEYRPARIICMFGCGGERSKLRRAGMGRVSARIADLTVLTQDNSRGEPFPEIFADIEEGIREENGTCIMIPDRYAAICFCLQTAQPGDFVFLLGKGHEEYQEIGGVKTPFSDVQTVRDILEISPKSWFGEKQDLEDEKQ